MAGRGFVLGNQAHLHTTIFYRFRRLNVCDIADGVTATTDMYTGNTDSLKSTTDSLRNIVGGTPALTDTSRLV
jgi:hypothetical protein